MSSIGAPAGAAPRQAVSMGEVEFYSQQGEPTHDDLSAMVAQQVPAVRGRYVDEDTQTLFILLTDQGQSLMAAVQALQHTFGSQILYEFIPVALPAQYGFTQLKAWNDQMVPALSTPGIVFTGIDEGHNRLSVGVEDLATQAQLWRLNWSIWASLLRPSTSCRASRTPFYVSLAEALRYRSRSPSVSSSS